MNVVGGNLIFELCDFVILWNDPVAYLELVKLDAAGDVPEEYEEAVEMALNHFRQLAVRRLTKLTYRALVLKDEFAKDSEVLLTEYCGMLINLEAAGLDPSTVFPPEVDIKNDLKRLVADYAERLMKNMRQEGPESESFGARIKLCMRSHKVLPHEFGTTLQELAKFGIVEG